MPDEWGQVGGGWLSPALERHRIMVSTKFIPAGAAVLDVGCGRARVLEFIRTPRSYVGIDVLESVLGANRKRYPQFQFRRVDVERDQLPLEKAFEVILMLACLEHFSFPRETLARLVALLRDGGRVILTTPHPSAKWVLRIGAEWGLFSKEAEGEHRHYFDGTLLQGIALDCGLRLSAYGRFQAGLNQVAVLERR